MGSQLECNEDPASVLTEGPIRLRPEERSSLRAGQPASTGFLKGCAGSPVVDIIDEKQATGSSVTRDPVPERSVVVRHSFYMLS